MPAAYGPWSRQDAVHPAVNRANPFECSLASGLVTEGQRQHRVHGVIQTRGGRLGRPSKAAVIEDARGDERMRELQQDGTRPPEEHDALGVDAPGDRGVTESVVTAGR